MCCTRMISIAIFVFAVWTVFEGGVIVVVVLVCIVRDESSQGRLYSIDHSPSLCQQVFCLFGAHLGDVIVVVVAVCIIRDESSQGRLSPKGNLHPCVRGSALCISHHLPLNTISHKL